MSVLLAQRLERAVSAVLQELDPITSHVQWEAFDEGYLWYELVACILGSNVSYESADAATRHIYLNGLLDNPGKVADFNRYESDICENLSSPIQSAEYSGTDIGKYRFPRLRASHIRRSAETIYQGEKTIGEILRTSRDSDDARTRITGVATGVGPKQASLFLGNVGFDSNLAVLDRHVLRYMSLLDMIAPTQAVTSLRVYKRIEVILQNYARTLRSDLSQLDLAIWVVMRVYQREFAA